jgi:hypothetical protein
MATVSEQIQEIYVGLLGRAADQAGLDYWTNEIEGGVLTIEQLRANIVNEQPEYAEGLGSMSRAQVVAELYERLFERAPEADGLEYWVNGDGASVNVDQLVYALSDGAGATDRLTLDNKVTAAEYYTAQSGDNYDQDDATASVDSVSSDSATVAASKAATDSAVANNATDSADLTVDIDSLEANEFNSQPGYTPGGDDLVNTLQDEDELTGRGDNPTLNVTLGSLSEEGTEAVVTPKLNGIETVNVEFTSGATGLNFQDTTGLQNLNVNRITSQNANVVLDELAASTTNLSVSDATRNATVEFAYREDELTATDNELNLTLDNVRLQDLTLSEGGDTAEDQGYGFETVNVAVTGTTNLDAFTLNANAEEDAEQGTSQTVNITADAALEVNDLTAEGAENINLTANADVVIAADEDNLLQVGNDGITTGELQNLVITGAGNVSIDGLDGDDQAVAGADNGITLTVDASAMTGDLMLGVAEASDAFDSAVFANSTDKDLSVTSGSGNDTIEVYEVLAGDITTNDGNDTVILSSNDDDATDAVENTVDMEGVSTIDTGAGDDTVVANDLLTTANDGNGIDDNASFGEVTAAAITTGEGNDTVVVGNLNSQQDHNHGVLDDNNADDTIFMVGATVDTGAGDDSVTVETVAEGASVNTGEGTDTLSVALTGATVLAADTDADVETVGDAGDETREVQQDGTVDRLGAIVDLGAGDDTASFTDSSSAAGSTSTLIVDRDAELRGGEGTDTLNVTALDAITVVTDTSIDDPNTTAVEGPNDVNANITGIETANLTVANQIDNATSTAVAGDTSLTNDDDETNGSITADVMRFDDALTAINLVSEEQAMLQGAGSEVYEAGTATEFTLKNLRDDIAVSLTAQEATGVNADDELEDDEVTDVTLTVDAADARGNDDSFTLNINADSGAFDLSLNMAATTTDMVADDASDSDDDDTLIENVTINLNDSNSHAIDMNGFGDAGQSDADVEGSDPVETSLTVGETKDGTEIVITNVNADTITVNGAADVEVVVDAANNYEITTGTGDDVINMIADTVRSDNATDDATDADSVDNTDEADVIAGGEGTDRLIVSGDNNLGSTTQLVGGNTDDDVFEELSSLEILEINNDTGAAQNNEVVLDEAAQDITNVQEIHLTGTTAGSAQTTDLTIGENFENDLLIDATTKTDAVDLVIESQDSDEDSDVVNLDVRLNLAAGAAVDFENTGDTDATVTVTATVTEAGVNAIYSGDGASDGADTLDLQVQNGAIDSIVLVDSDDDAADNTDENGTIFVTVSDDWAEDALTIDVSAIDNNDQDNGAGAGTAGDGIIHEDEYDASILTGGVIVDASGESDASVTVNGSANNDTILGGAGADTLEGNAGDDHIEGGSGNDTISGGAGDDTLRGDLGVDTISGGAGDDQITGGEGADVLSGGDGADTFVIASVSESNSDNADTISDFETGVDKLDVTLTVENGTTVNLGKFNAVSSLAEGDNSLEGTNNVKVAGDAFYGEGQLVIDVDGDGDITSQADIIVNSASEIAADDIDFTINATDGNDYTVRLGQGVDTINTGAGDDTFVIVGSIDAAQATAYENAGNNLGQTVGGNVADVVNYNDDLLVARTETEANADDEINAGAGNDTLHVYGAASLVGMTLNGIETVVVHSEVVIDLNDFDVLENITFEGTEGHTLTVLDINGDEITGVAALQALQAAGIIISVIDDSTFTIGGETYSTAAELETAYENEGGVLKTDDELVSLTLTTFEDYQDESVSVLAATTTVIYNGDVADADELMALAGDENVDQITVTNAVTLTLDQFETAAAKLAAGAGNSMVTVQDDLTLSDAQDLQDNDDVVAIENTGDIAISDQNVAAELTKLSNVDGGTTTVTDVSINSQAEYDALYANAAVTDINLTNAGEITLSLTSVNVDDTKLQSNGDVTALAANQGEVDALSAQDITDLVANNVDILDVDGGGEISLTLAQFNAAVAAGLTLADATVTVTLTQGEVDNLTAQNIADLKTNGADQIDVSGADAINVTVEQAEAIDTANLVYVDATVTVVDTSAAISGTDLEALVTSGVTNVDSEEDGVAFTLTVDEAAALNTGLTAGDTMTVSDTSSNLSGATMTDLETWGVDTIDSTQDGTAFEVEYSDEVDMATLAYTAGDTIRATGVSGDISDEAFANIDHIELVSSGEVSVTVTAEQFEILEDGGATANTITFGDNENVTDVVLDVVNSSADTYVLFDGTNSVTIGNGSAADINEGTNGGQTTITVEGTYTGTFSSTNTDDAVILEDGADISGAGGLVLPDMMLNGDATINDAQHNAPAIVAEAGDNTLTIADSVTGAAHTTVENYVLAVGGNFTILSATNVSVTSGTATITTSGDTLTGEIGGEVAATVNITADDDDDFTGATFSNVDLLTVGDAVVHIDESNLANLGTIDFNDSNDTLSLVATDDAVFDFSNVSITDTGAGTNHNIYFEDDADVTFDAADLTGIINEISVEDTGDDHEITLNDAADLSGIDIDDGIDSLNFNNFAMTLDQENVESDFDAFDGGTTGQITTSGDTDFDFGTKLTGVTVIEAASVTGARTIAIGADSSVTTLNLGDIVAGVTVDSDTNITIDATDAVTGDEDLTLDGTGDLTVTNFVGAEIYVTDTTATGAISVSFAAAVGDVDVQANDTAASTTVDMDAMTTADTLTVSGDGDATVNNATDGQVTTTTSGDVTVNGAGYTLTGGQTITTGAGDDTINVVAYSTVSSSSNDVTIVTGAGTDAINIASGAEAVIVDYTTAADSTIGDMDVITGFRAGVDSIGTADVGAAFTQQIIASADTASLVAAFNSAVAAAITLDGTNWDGAGDILLVTVEAGTAEGTYALVNDGANGTLTAADVAFELVDVVGSLTAGDFVDLVP